MLTSLEYITKELEQMDSMFVGFIVKYAFDKRLNAHIIQISPREEFREHEVLIEWELDFMERFEALYGEDLILSEPHSFHDMTNLIYEKSLVLPLSFIVDNKYTLQNLVHDFDCSLFEEEFLAA